MIAETRLQLRFKGTRTYVQGPDIYDAVCRVLAAEGISAAEKLDIICHRIVSTNLTLSELPEGSDVPEGIHVLFRFQSDAKSRVLVLLENGETIDAREPYDEPALVAFMEKDLGMKRISICCQPGYSNSETVVSLNKELLTRAFPEAKGKWLFTRLQTRVPLISRKFERLEVQFLGHSNFRITRSSLFGDGEPLGTLYFSLLPAE